MALVTLTTDWGIKDHYLASVKGSLYSALPSLTIVDISHSITPFNLNETSIILRNCYRDFPDGSIHIIGVDSESTSEKPHVAIKMDNHYFIGADSGVFSLIFNRFPDQVVLIEKETMPSKFTFSTRDVFVGVAKYIAEHNSITALGKPVQQLRQFMPFAPVVEHDEATNSTVISGKVIYVDNYQNAKTNITRELFENNSHNREFVIVFNTFNDNLHKISNYYSDAPAGEMVAVFDSEDMLEIAINKGKAGSLLGLSLDTRVRVIFN